MELALSLGENTAKPFSYSFLDKPQKMVVSGGGGGGGGGRDIGFCMGLGGSDQDEDEERRRGSSLDPPVQLDLLPSAPVQRSSQSSTTAAVPPPPPPPPPQLMSFSWLTQNLTVGGEPGSSSGQGRRVEVNRRSTGVAAAMEEGTPLSSPNSTTASSFQMEFLNCRNIGRSKHTTTGSNKRDLEPTNYYYYNNNNNNEGENDNRGATSRTSTDQEDDNAMAARKKLRLTKQQSAFLEESFKEHNTLNPKQKLALAKQLNLRPRQVEVWFQNRRARTKLKQTEVDCEQLKRCCETLTEENRRLQKELQELRALKSSQPFYMQLPATTLTMCPSCERVATTTATATANAAPAAACAEANTTLSLAKPREHLLPFPTSKLHQATKAGAS